MEKIRVLIADDHAVVREGLRILIGAERDLEILGEADTGTKAAAMARKLKPDVVLMDLAMPRCNGARAAQTISRQSPSSRVLFLSAYCDEGLVRMALDAGAAGYVTKHSAAQDLLTAIREVSRGHQFFSSNVTQRMDRQMQFELSCGRRNPMASGLTPREVQMVKLVAEGLANKEIASQLGISIKTVEKHRQAAMDKLGLHDTAGVTRYAIAKSIVGQPGSRLSE